MKSYGEETKHLKLRKNLTSTEVFCSATVQGLLGSMGRGLRLCIGLSLTTILFSGPRALWSSIQSYINRQVSHQVNCIIFTDCNKITSISMSIKCISAVTSISPCDCVVFWSKIQESCVLTNLFIIFANLNFK